jgi:aerobic carbon-monoxide dehydrogenase small subunit
MNDITFTLNGQKISAAVEPRLHLADFLRERQHLTGTHIGCEHGVCGACTLLIDGEPARSCITFAAACEGRDIRSIEGLEEDAVTAALREAFKAEHALQCGYCTPGMMVTARDIVLRLPDADAQRIRQELTGNLCRCTGYNGIVKAIQRVLAQRLGAVLPERPALPEMVVPELIVAAPVSVAAARAPAASGDGSALTQQLRVQLSHAELWAALQQPELVASCVPGAQLTEVRDGRMTGEMQVSLGPIQGRFSGHAVVTYDVAAFAGSIRGEGRDQFTGTRLSGGADFHIVAAGEAETVLHLAITYTMRGALAQFARGPVVKAFAEEIVGLVGRNLQARLRGEAAATTVRRMSALQLLGAVLARWCRKILSGRDG